MTTPSEIKQAIARAELQKGLVTAQATIDKMMAQLKREGVAPKTIQECLSVCGTQLEHDVRRLDKQLTPDSGTTQAKAIQVTHPLQEVLLLNQIGAEPLYYTRSKGADGRIYDEYTVLRETASGNKAETIVWFDITADYDKFVKLTKRTATSAEAAKPGMCASCEKPEKQDLLRKCKGCQMVFYCDKKCQRNHWRNGHKKICQGIQAEEKKLEKRIAELDKTTFVAKEIMPQAADVWKKHEEELEAWMLLQKYNGHVPSGVLNAPQNAVSKEIIERSEFKLHHDKAKKEIVGELQFKS